MTSKAEYEAQVEGLHAQADAYARHFGYTYGAINGHNNSWDAFRHAYVSAEMTRVHGSLTAKILGDMHEIKGDFTRDQPWAEKNMDLWNNAAGRKIGENSYNAADSARRVSNALDNGSLIKDPKDPRKHSSTPPQPNDKDPEVCCEECGAAHTFPPIPWPPAPNEAYLDDGQEFIIPPMTVPPFNLPVVAVASRMALTDESQGELTTSTESAIELTLSTTSQVELATWVEPLQASIDSAMAVIVETRVDVIQIPTLVAEVEIAIDPMVSNWSDHREADIAVV
ncbi:DUF6973 domain-containing protein [Janthinobacterium sp. MDT1-19]|uniref:DUF6973 domain-containing protein n=1 Tax=Janthinobacterium sp. MDT1-19 TaxID=1259339 RepID=UPI003F1FFEC3